MLQVVQVFEEMQKSLFPHPFRKKNAHVLYCHSKMRSPYFVWVKILYETGDVGRVLNQAVLAKEHFFI